MIFQIDEADEKPAPKVKAPDKQARQWIDIGVKFKQSGLTAKKFAQDNNINYGTFTKNMFRYKDSIDIALGALQAGKKSEKDLTKREREVLMINSFRQSIKAKMSTEGTGSKTKSAQWFASTMKQNIRAHKVTKPSPGKVYAFAYDAKHKATLPFWDKYPLIVFLGFSNSSKAGTKLMHGLNMHYIPPKARQQFLEDLLKQYASTKVLSNSTTLKIDWSKVKGFPGSDKMIKAYLPSHVVGTFMEVKPSDWANVVMLPTAKFVSGPKNKPFSSRSVWK